MEFGERLLGLQARREREEILRYHLRVEIFLECSARAHLTLSGIVVIVIAVYSCMELLAKLRTSIVDKSFFGDASRLCDSAA